MIALAMTMAMAKTKKGGGGGFHTRRRSGSALNARHREEEDEREYFETYRRRANDNDDSNDNSHEVEDGVGADSINGSGSASESGPSGSSGAYLTRLVEVLHEGPSREEGSSVAMQHNESLEDIEGQAYGQVHVLVNEETLAVEDSDHDVDDVWYDVYDLSALGVPRDGDDGDDIDGGEVSHAQPQAGDYNGHNDDEDDEEGLEEGHGDEDDQWNWGAVGEAGDVFYDSYGDNHDSQASCEDANSSDYYSNRDNDIDDDDNDDDDDDDMEGYRCGDRDRDRERDGDSTDAALTRDTASSTNPRILSRARAFSMYFDRLSKLSDNDKQRDKLKFWAR